MIGNTAAPITRQRYLQGMTIVRFFDRMKRNQDRFLQNVRRASISPIDRAFFASLPHPVHVYVLAEDWCEDAVFGLPVLARLIEDAGRPDVRVAFRDANMDIMGGHLKEGKFSAIPVYVVLDEHFNELGSIIERSSRATTAMKEVARAVLVANPGYALPDAGPFEFEKMSEEGRAAVHRAIDAARAAQGGQWNQYLVDDLRALAAKSL